MDYASAQRYLQVQLTVTQKCLSEEIKVLSGLDRLAEVYMDGPERSSREKQQQRDKLTSQRTATLTRMHFFQADHDRLLNVSHELSDLCQQGGSHMTYFIDRYLSLLFPQREARMVAESFGVGINCCGMGPPSTTTLRIAIGTSVGFL